MKEYIQTITLEEARQLADQLALIKLNPYRTNETIPLLSEHMLEAECCWFFFRNKQIVGPEDGFRSWDCAYSVSKRGDVGTIIDLSHDPEKLAAYIQQFSDRCKEMGV
ncbi:hypothetical protein B5M42_023110 [Paenibacillus athensensis]|uniref:Uncharacterized protein n=1 Tax=Paenibacillus athensensis TaxID=1967502 RepID=A0A4Y8PU79_9BACL|nr:hypothetical protein [Paenibacillus athensensis]MCD1261695.1 hypothetical protein [Paenibacillus athensensis]